jgi:hypothetical protein
VTSFFCRFGVPIELYIYQGRTFESILKQKALERLGISKTSATLLHPLSDGLVECYVKTIEENLREVVRTHQRDWDETYLSVGLRNINPRNYGRDACLQGVRAATSPTVSPDVRGSSRQGTVDDRLGS